MISQFNEVGKTLQEEMESFPKEIEKVRTSHGLSIGQHGPNHLGL